jgi:hypothetical protein
MSSGMKGKAARTRDRKRHTEDGLPRDAKDMKIEDWADLHYGMEAIKAKIAARHRKERENARKPLSNT